jgi:hypothetical protein
MKGIRIPSLISGGAMPDGASAALWLRYRSANDRDHSKEKSNARDCEFQKPIVRGRRSGPIRYDQIEIRFYERRHHRTARRETQRDPRSQTWIAFG